MELDASEVAPAELPVNAGQARQEIKAKHKGLTIESFEGPRDEPWGRSSWAYCLTGPKLAEVPNRPGKTEMRRQAVTIVFEHDGHDLTTQRLNGWRVP